MPKTNAVRLLEAAGIAYRLVEYRYDETQLGVDKIARDNGLELERIFKTIVLKTENNQVVVAVTPGDKSLDFKILARLSACKKIHLAEMKELLSLTGYIRGGCSPVGMKKHFPVFIDQSALGHQHIFVNAGARGLLMEVAPDELGRLCNAVFEHITT
jgi:Cys-tRNA(Pro)/Cys-tRNA(Cys) deacylase